MIFSRDIDAVIVATPDDLHHAMVMAAVGAGKHVVCEEPLARTVEQAVEMAQGAMAAGGYHSVALLADGTVWSCGNGGHGQMGDGTHVNAAEVPVAAQGITNAVGVAAAIQSTIVLLADGTVKVWGGGVLGDGAATISYVPITISDL